MRPDEPSLYAEAVNIQSAEETVAPLTLREYLLLQNSYENQQAFNPSNPIVYPHTFNLPPSEVQDVKLRLTQQGSTLLPDLYYVAVTSPQMELPAKNIYFAVSSQVNLTFKLGATEALVWAMDLPSQTPVANAPITIYDSNGNQLISGTTDDKGLWKGAVEPREGQLFAVLGTPGSENFALATSSWNLGISAWDFGYRIDTRPPRTKIYMYTDRPMYRPGQTVYFRGVARQAFNGRYELPPMNEVPLTLRDANGTQLFSLNAQLSPYGTFNGEYQLPGDAVPGYYTFQNEEFDLWFSFQVAEYRKPEINLSVGFSADEIKLGEEATADINARYFFDAPVNDMEVNWAVYARPDSFYIANYETGVIDTSWLNVFRVPDLDYDYFGNQIEQGTGRTDRDGLLSIALPELPEAETGQILTIEVTAQDEAGILFLLFLNPTISASHSLIRPQTREEIRPVLEYLARYEKRGDIIYIYHGAITAVRYYSNHVPLRSSTVEGIFSRNWVDYEREIDKLCGNQRVWVLFSHVLPCDWRNLGLDEERFFLNLLDRIGSRRDSLLKPGASVYLYELTPDCAGRIAFQSSDAQEWNRCY